MSMTTKQLEAAAVAAHTEGTDWTAFWDRYRHAIALCEPFDRGRFHRLVRRLTALVAAGNLDGAEPVAAAWELDEDQEPRPVPIITDTETAARCLWQPGDGSESQ